jgi:hypothetical protein
MCPSKTLLFASTIKLSFSTGYELQGLRFLHWCSTGVLECWTLKIKVLQFFGKWVPIGPVTHFTSQKICICRWEFCTLWHGGIYIIGWEDYSTLLVFTTATRLLPVFNLWCHSCLLPHASATKHCGSFVDLLPHFFRLPSYLPTYCSLRLDKTLNKADSVNDMVMWL